MNTKTEESDSIKLDQVVEGEVTAIDRTNVYIDLPPYGTGIIYGREFLVAKDILRKTKIGDTISAKVISIETPEGYIDLSLKEARKAYIWNEAEEALKTERVYEVIVKDANRGGLVIDWNGIRGFLPASQLTEENYPKVINKNKDVIMNELKKLIGKTLQVTINTLNREDDTIIFTEVQADGKTKSSIDKANALNYEVGDEKSAVVSGVVDFGVFVTIDNKVEGLVHKSEIDWGIVNDPHQLFNIGEQIKVKIIDINKEDNKFSFSIRQLKKNPWETVDERYKLGDTVRGVVIKYNEHGAFASIEPGISGLIHVSNFENEEDLRLKIEIGKAYEFVINNLEPSKQKLMLAPKK